MGHRAMPPMSRGVGHMGVGRPPDFRSGSSSLATGGGSGRRRGLVFSTGLGASRTDMGRLAFVGHAAGWRTGRNQTDACRSAVSPGRPRRPRQVWEIDHAWVMCVWFPKWPIQRLRSARPELKRSRACAVRRPKSAPHDYGVQSEIRTPGHLHRSAAGRGQIALTQSGLPSR